MKNRIQPMALAAFLAFGGSAAAQRTVYVTPSEADIRSGTGFGGPVVATVRKGTALTVVQDSKLRLKVRTSDGTEGWITARQVQDNPPDRGRGLGGLVRDDRDITEMRTAATNRGLVGEEAREMAEAQGVPEDAVEQADTTDNLAASITDAEVEAFIKEGGLTL